MVRLGSGKQIKAKRMGKSGWQSVKRDDQSGGIRWTGIARQALLPGEPPMRTLRSGEDLLDGARAAWWSEWSETFQADRLATDHLQPGSPDATAWPVTPENRSRRKWCAGWIGRWRGIRVRRGKWPQDRTDPSWLDRGAALLTLCLPIAGTTMASACGIQEP